MIGLYCLLPTAYCLLPATMIGLFCLLPTAYCLLPATVPLSIDSPRLLAAAMALAFATAVVAMLRRPAMPRGGMALMALGMLLLAAAAGGPMRHRTAIGQAVVMVDLSASTRVATFRDRARLDARIAELLGDAPHRTIFFSEVNAPVDVPGAILPDLPGDRTVFSPPEVGPVLLFSDGRFEIPEFAPPTYVVADPALDRPGDAAVTRLELRGRDAAVTVSLGQKPRELTLEGVEGAAKAAVPGPMVVTRPLSPGAMRVIASLAPGDAWPENDLLIATASPPLASERWWVGGAPPGGAWRAIPQLPTDPAAWLAPSIVVLDNVPATAIPIPQQDRLTEYVRDLGGSLVIVGGDHAFAAGGYAGSALESLSPLASSPPRPTEHWMLLADSSGSMNALADGAGGVTRWQLISGAIVQLLPELPPDDLVSVGSFADDLRWWVSARSARETARQAGDLPPPGTTPHGATNLQAALQAIAAGAEPALSKHLLLLTDADTELDHPDALAAALAGKNIHVHLLAIEEGKALPALQQIIQATGGTLVRQMDPKQWRQAAQQLLRSAMPDRLLSDPVDVHFAAELAALPTRAVRPWNRTWLKPEARQLADGTFQAGPVPLAAVWPVGSGQTAAFAFGASAGEVKALAHRIAQLPRDPRFRVAWDGGSPLRVAVDAAEADGTWLNNQKLRLEIAAEGGGSPQSFAIPQVGPGRYEISLPSSRSPSFAAVWAGNRVIDRTALAGRYAPEFDSIGNDADAMHELAVRSGGRVIGPGEHGRIDFRWPRRDVPLQSWVAAAGAALIAAGLVAWRLRG